MKDSVANRPKRVHDLLAKEIEDFNKKKYNGLLPFTQASAQYAQEKRRLEEQLAALQKKIGGGGRLV